MLQRREILLFALAGTIAACTKQAVLNPQSAAQDAVRQQFSDIESRIGGRLGVALVDSDGNLLASHRGDERFAMCSTFKAPLASAMFVAHEDSRLDMNASFALKEDDLVPYAPFVEAKLAAGEETTLKELAKSTVQISDNAAANLIIRAIGGPEAFTRFVRSKGDEMTRLDRMEPELNENAIGDPRDTTTPEAMSRLMQRILIHDAATDSSALTLQKWMEGSITGKDRIRAGLPKSWPVGDKTGTAPGGKAYNDIAIIWPSGNSEYRADPVILTVYTDRPTASADNVNQAIADVARIVTRMIGLPD